MKKSTLKINIKYSEVLKVHYFFLTDRQQRLIKEELEENSMREL